MFKKMTSFIGRLDEIIAAIALIMIIGITVFGVFMRYVLGEPLMWTEESTLALMVLFTFLGSSVAFRDNGHVSIDFLVERMNVGMRKMVTVFGYVVLIIVVTIVFIWFGYQLAMQASGKLTAILKIPYMFIDFSVVLCGIYSLFRLLGGLKKLLTRG